MTDKFSTTKRSEIMSKIKSKDSKIEVSFRRQLWKNGLRYRKNSNKHFGHPDIVVVKMRLVIFVDSCFWHGCKKHFQLPKTRSKFWLNKINSNRQRDIAVNNYYKKNNWRIYRFWEHDLIDLDSLAKKIISSL